jgi:cation:H+ antiporter
VTSLEAALSGSPGIAIGNVVGSNIGNVLLILGIATVLAPIAVDPSAFRRDGVVLVLATLFCLAAVLSGAFSRVSGMIALGALTTYLVLTLRFESRRNRTAAADVYAETADAVPGPHTSLTVSLGLALIGLTATIFAAKAMVAGAVGLATLAGISETVIGLTIVAIGTSMPELVTSVIAVRKGQGEVALGNVVGSNIFNIFGILGITALVQPMDVPPEIIGLDVWVMCAATLLLLVCARTGWTIHRREGALMLGCYGIYLAVLLI